MTTDVNTIISLRLDMISQIDENCFSNNIFFFLKVSFWKYILFVFATIQ